MNKYYSLSDDQRKELVKLELSVKERALQLSEKVKQVVAEFDGKQLNKRLQTALQKIDDNLHVHNEYNSFDIQYIDYNNRSIQAINGTHYINNNTAYISATAKQNAYGDSSLSDDNKIIASVVIASIDKQVEYLTSEIKEAKKQMALVDEYRKNKQRIMEEIEDQNRINYTIRTYFDLEIRR